MLLTKELIEEAVKLVSPAALAILDAKGTTWGPKWVEGYVSSDGLSERLGFVIGEYSGSPWPKEWGGRKNFLDIALAKLLVVEREKLSTSVIVATRPWLLRDGEYLYAGGVARDGIYVAVSGAKSYVDEALAEMVLSAIIMLAHLKCDKMKQEGKNQI